MVVGRGEYWSAGVRWCFNRESTEIRISDLGRDVKGLGNDDVP